MPVKKLKDFLDSNNIKYATIQHSKAYTASEIAQSAHISGRKLAKVVMIKVDGRMAMAVLPATDHIAINIIKAYLGAHSVEIAEEQEFKDMFPDCEVGAMPPFGNLYGVEVYISEKINLDDEIAFNAGTLRELIMLSVKDYKELVKPKIITM